MSKYPLISHGLVALMLSCLASASFAADHELDLEYQAAWGNTTLAISEAHWRFTDTGYSLSSTTQTKGAFSFVFPFTGTVRLNGTFNDTYHPMMIVNGSEGRRDIWTATTIWNEEGTIQNTSRDPELDLEEVFPLASETFVDVVDPFSAMLRGLQNLQNTQNCNGSWETYDGRRHSELSLHDFGTTKLEADRPWSYSGETYVCGILAKPLGGHSRDTKWRKADADPEKIKIYIAKLHTDLLIPVRIEIDGILGDVIIRLNVRDSEF